MSARLRGIARETEAIVAAGGYRAPGGGSVEIGEAVAAARSATRVYGPDPVPAPRTEPGDTVLRVTGESSLAAARRLTADDGPVAVLNFAAARNPGGGFLNGAQAQEEALCRSSALHTCVRAARSFYEHHRAPFSTDRVIHSPGVPVFRDDRGPLLDTPYTAAFLTSAAPNASVVLRRKPERAPDLPRALARRAERVLETAAAHGHRRLVLGAWGCGVFGNDPAQVAGAFRDLLTGDGRFAGQFAHVVFGVLDRTGVVRAAFARTFAGVAEAQRQP